MPACPLKRCKTPDFVAICCRAYAVLAYFNFRGYLKLTMPKQSGRWKSGFSESIGAHEI